MHILIFYKQGRGTTDNNNMHISKMSFDIKNMYNSLAKTLRTVTK